MIAYADQAIGARIRSESTFCKIKMTHSDTFADIRKILACVKVSDRVCNRQMDVCELIIEAPLAAIELDSSDTLAFCHVLFFPLSVINKKGGIAATPQNHDYGSVTGVPWNAGILTLTVGATG